MDIYDLVSMFNVSFPEHRTVILVTGYCGQRVVAASKIHFENLWSNLN